MSEHGFVSNFGSIGIRQKLRGNREPEIIFTLLGDVRTRSIENEPYRNCCRLLFFRRKLRKRHERLFRYKFGTVCQHVTFSTFVRR